jgi:5-formyltetrahydrofolate cyclo-ligase
LTNRKQTIRTDMLQRRDQLTPEDVAACSAAIRRRLFDAPAYAEAACLSCYVSMGNEVDTHAIVRQAIAAGKRVAVPLCRKGRKLVHRQIATLGDLTPSQFGLLEPTDPSLSEVDPSAFDLILVPGLAFDRSGNRIGFGAGYYDGFLSQTAAPKVALAYDFQLIDRVPVEPHDVPLNAVVTESGFHGCHT